MRHPPPLEEGSRVAVVSPAGPVTSEILSDGLAILDSWNLEVDLHPDVYATDAERGYLAGDDPVRVEAVQTALDDPAYDAVVFSRGGYGTMRLLPRLDFDHFVENPKSLVGFSDLTALHLYVAGDLDVVSLHAPVVKSLRLHRRGSETLTALRAALFGRRSTPLRIEGLETVRGGGADGRLLGGNLTLVAAMLDSPYCPDLSDAILVLEETGEEDYRLDRLLTSLRLSETAGTPAAIALGDFTDCGGAYVGDRSIGAFVRSIAEEFGIPTVADLPIGHEHRNLALPMGVPASLEADEGRLVVHEDLTAT